MKKLAVIALLGMGMWLSSCASGTNTPVVQTGAGGIWEAQLVGGLGEASLLDFTVQFSVGAGGGPLDITSIPAFLNNNQNSCFPAVSGYSGSAVLATSASNQVTGSLSFTVSSGTSSTVTTASTLTLTAGPDSTPPTEGVTGTSSGTSDNSALSNGVVQGVWSLSGGTGCTGSGTFTMCQEAVPNNGACSTTAQDRRARRD
jgi:hypothetical protein